MWTRSRSFEFMTNPDGFAGDFNAHDPRQYGHAAAPRPLARPRREGTRRARCLARSVRRDGGGARPGRAHHRFARAGARGVVGNRAIEPPHVTERRADAQHPDGVQHRPQAPGHLTARLRAVARAAANRALRAHGVVRLLCRTDVRPRRAPAQRRERVRGAAGGDGGPARRCAGDCRHRVGPAFTPDFSPRDDGRPAGAARIGRHAGHADEDRPRRGSRSPTSATAWSASPASSPTSARPRRSGPRPSCEAGSRPCARMSRR